MVSSLTKRPCLSGMFFFPRLLKQNPSFGILYLRVLFLFAGGICWHYFPGVSSQFKNTYVGGFDRNHFQDFSGQYVVNRLFIWFLPIRFGAFDSQSLVAKHRHFVSSPIEIPEDSSGLGKRGEDLSRYFVEVPWKLKPKSCLLTDLW